MLLFFSFLFFADLTPHLSQDPSDATQNGVFLQQYYAGLNPGGLFLEDFNEWPDYAVPIHITGPDQWLWFNEGYLSGTEGLSSANITFAAGVTNWKDRKTALGIQGPGDFTIDGVSFYGDYGYVQVQDGSTGIQPWYGGGIQTPGWDHGTLNIQHMEVKGFQIGVHGRVGEAPGTCRLRFEDAYVDGYVAAAMYHNASTDAHEFLAFNSTFSLVPLTNGHGDGTYVHPGISYLAKDCKFTTTQKIAGQTLYGKYGINYYGSSSIQGAPTRFFRVINCKFDGTDYGFYASPIMTYATYPPNEGALIKGCKFLGPGCKGQAIRLRSAATVDSCLFTGERGILAYNVPDNVPGEFLIKNCDMQLTQSSMLNMGGKLCEWRVENTRFDMSNFDGWAITRTDGANEVAKVTFNNCESVGLAINSRGIYDGKGPAYVNGGDWSYSCSYNQYGWKNILGTGGEITGATIYQNGGLGIVDPAPGWVLMNNQVTHIPQ